MSATSDRVLMGILCLAFCLTLPGQGLAPAVPGGPALGEGPAAPLAPADLAWYERRILRASDRQAADQLGFAVSLDGDTLAVGASYEDGGPGNPASDAGGVYIFQRNLGGTEAWGEVKAVHAADQAASAGFGGAVSLSGDTLAVGAPVAGYMGAVYLFGRNVGGANQWGQVKKITASDVALFDGFGLAVSLNGDTLAVGVMRKNGEMGAVYIFKRNLGGADQWGEAKKILASDAASGDRFGCAVSLSGDTLAVGAHREDGGASAQSNAGAAYIFSRNLGGAEQWGEAKILHAPDLQADDYFGIAVGLSGDTVAVGASREDGPGSASSNAGAAYVFQRNLGGTEAWGCAQTLHASDMQAEDYFGYAVSLSGDTLAVGAYQEDGFYGDQASAGSAYLFGRNQGGAEQWGEVKEIRASDAQAGDTFGWAVSLSGSALALGAPLEDGGGGDPLADAGAAYLFSLPAAGVDSDLDGVLNESDCRPYDPTLYSIPSEAQDLRVYTGTSGLEWRWATPANPGGTSVLYDLVRSSDPSSFVGANCLPGEAGGTDTVALLDGDPPGPVLYYLVRSRNGCGGNLGTGTGGLPRYAPDCY